MAFRFTSREADKLYTFFAIIEKCRIETVVLKLNQEYDKRKCIGEKKMEKYLEDCLFRYRKLNNDASKNIEALKKNRLYFSTPVNFNDPYDNRIYVDKEKMEFAIRENWEHMDDYLNRLKEYDAILAHFGKMIWISDKKTEFQNNFLNMINYFIDKIRDNYRNYMKIICFSEEYDSELMWSHYAENHKGFLIAYKKEDIENSTIFSKDNENINKKIKLSKVQYTNKQIDMTKCIHDYLLKYWLPSNLDVSSIPEIPNRILRDMATTKSESWKYEKEWRLIPRIIDISQENPISYIEIKPKAIIAGTQCTNEDKKLLTNIAKEKKIPFYEMQISSGIQYNLEIK